MAVLDKSLVFVGILHAHDIVGEAGLDNFDSRPNVWLGPQNVQGVREDQVEVAR
jgi:hypothetical protein